MTRPDDRTPPQQPLVDPALDAAWRDESNEMPPPALDASILAAAHRAVNAGPREAGADRLAEAREPERWWWPLAAAATIGAIAFGVLQLWPAFDAGQAVVSDVPPVPPGVVRKGERSAAPADQRDAATASSTFRAGEQPRTTEMQREPALTPPPSAPSPQQAPRDAAKPAVSPLGESDGRRAMALGSARPMSGESERPTAPTETTRGRAPAAAASPPAPAATPLAAGAPVPQPAAPDAAKSAGPAPAAAPNPVPTAPAPTAPAASAAPPPAAPAPKAATAAQRVAPSAAVNNGAVAPARTAEQWIAEIAKLRGEGRERDAESALNAFRAAHADADARLPPELRAWAATVRRP